MEIDYEKQKIFISIIELFNIKKIFKKFFVTAAMKTATHQPQVKEKSPGQGDACTRRKMLQRLPVHVNIFAQPNCAKRLIERSTMPHSSLVRKKQTIDEQVIEGQRLWPQRYANIILLRYLHNR